MNEFLSFIQPDGLGWCEIRAIKDGRVKQWWYQDREAAARTAFEQSDERWDAYYGVIPRMYDSGAASAVYPATWALWADLDAKIHGSKQQSLMALVRYALPPSVVVDSGHGYHAYWRLDKPAEWNTAHLAMVGIARELQGDHVYDQPRILRIPGTVNWKEPEHPVPVRTIVFDTTNVRRISEFHRQIERGDDIESPRETITVPYVPPAKRDDLPDWLVQLIRDGAPQGQRSEAAFKAMCHLARRGWSDAEIRSAFDGGGIGAKMRERRDADRWFNRSLQRARENLY